VSDGLQKGSFVLRFIHFIVSIKIAIAAEYRSSPTVFLDLRRRLKGSKLRRNIRDCRKFLFGGLKYGPQLVDSNYSKSQLYSPEPPEERGAFIT
jgi:hypothetical protein